MTVCIGPRERHAAPLPHAGDGAFRIGHVRATPAPALARWVEHYWLTRWDRRGQPARTATALLDPCVHLHVAAGRADIMGVVRGTYRTEIADAGWVVGARFRPGGFHPFVRRSVAEWTDRVVSVDDVFGDASGAAAWARALSDAVDAVDACTGDAAAHAALVASHLDAFLGALAPAPDAVAEEMAGLVASLAALADVRRVGALAAASGRSERTLHRLFRQYVGVSPAWVLRRYRLGTAAARLTAHPPADVQGLAYELGYSDQAHFIRDFRATLGVTPGAYVSARR